MDCVNEIHTLIREVNQIIEGNQESTKPAQYWLESGAKILIYIDNNIVNNIAINNGTPKDYSSSSESILECIFHVIANVPRVNDPYQHDLWSQHLVATTKFFPDDLEDNGQDDPASENLISFYELALSRFCSFTCQLLGDKLHYVQKLILKHVFGENNVCSLFASDIYTFLYRVVHPDHKYAMCQLVMNMCKIAPPQLLIKGAALINRLNNSSVNFENPKYSYLLDFNE